MALRRVTAALAGTRANTPSSAAQPVASAKLHFAMAEGRRVGHIWPETCWSPQRSGARPEVDSLLVALRG